MDNLPTMGLRKCTLRELEPYKSNVMIICIIISKLRPKKFGSKTDNGEERAVWNFTVRDSPSDYINVSVWGNAESILNMNEKIQIGDIVNLEKPTIEVRHAEDFGEQFHPMVTSPFKLTMNENSSDIKLLRDLDGLEYLTKLLNVPTKPIANFFSLANIHTNVKQLEGKFVDILVSVRSVGNVRQVNTRSGLTSVRNVTVFDHSSPALTISIWNEEFIARAAMWKPRLTILFMTDMKVSFDTFHNSATASITGRTIVTEDPDCFEAQSLKSYARNAAIQPSAILDQITVSIPDPSTINTVMNIRQILKRIETISNMTTVVPEDLQFTALLFAHVTAMDLDGFFPILTTRCSKCKALIRNSDKCENPSCLVGMGEESDPPETDFDFQITLSDQTGSLANCKLKGVYAEKTLNCTAQEFQLLSDEDKSAMKWVKLMERCASRILVFCPRKRKPNITILSCDLCSPSEYLNRL